MTDADPQWVEVASLSKLDPEFPVQAVIGEAELAVGIADGQVFALDNICSHAFARLSDGWVQGTEIFCPLHQGSFCVRTGEAVAEPCVDPVRTHPTRVEGDAVLVDVSALTGARST